MPVATLHGVLDPVVLVEMSEHIASLVPGAESTCLSGVGHLAFVESEEAFNAAVRSLVARRDGAIQAPLS